MLKDSGFKQALRTHKSKMSDSEPPEVVKLLKSCPLSSKRGLQWSSEMREKLQSSENDFVKAETLRRLAADADLKSGAANLHNKQDALLAERLNLFLLLFPLYNLSPLYVLLT